MGNKKIILWEYQKKRVCEFYGCSDLHGNQYPDCIWENDKMGIEASKACHLHEVRQFINKLNEPCEHPLILDIHEEGEKERVGTICFDCGEEWRR